MKTLQFNYTKASENEDCFIVAFGNPVDGSDDYIVFQMAKEFDDQDRDLGMDSVYLEINDQSRSGYKSIGRIVCTKRTIFLEFSESGLETFKNFNPLQIVSNGIEKDILAAHEMLKSMAISSCIEFVETA